MRDAYKFNRLRKYKRKKLKASDPLALKYWNYWFKCFGVHENLWLL